MHDVVVCLVQATSEMSVYFTGCVQLDSLTNQRLPDCTAALSAAAAVGLLGQIA